MDVFFDFVLLPILLLFGFGNYVIINQFNSDSNTVNLRLYLSVVVYYLVVNVLGFVFLLKGYSSFEKGIFLFAELLASPMLLIFPIANLQKRIQWRFRRVLSRTFLVVFGIVLTLGLINLTSTSTNWENSHSLLGFGLVFISLPNILLASAMTSNFQFIGITKMLTSGTALVIYILNLIFQDPDATNADMNVFALIISCYLMVEALFFIRKGRN